MEIQLKNLSKTYEKTVLDGLNYTFESGKLYVIKGVSGCGKTTLFNVIGGIDPEYEGEVIMPKKCRTAYIFQQSLLLSSLTVRENLLLIHPNQKKVESLSKALGIHDLLDRLPESLSGGERQRAAIVRALLTGPNILLADEPTASLDGKNAEAVTRMIAGLRTEERVILVATHDAYFDPYADEIIELDYGTLGAITKNERPERPTYEEKDLYEWNARVQITTWGNRYCADTGGLRDYAHKEWQGLLSDFYAPRWKAFFDHLRQDLEKMGKPNPDMLGTGANSNKTADELFKMALPQEVLLDYYPMEENWVLHHPHNYTATPEGNPVDVARKVFNQLTEKK